MFAHFPPPPAQVAQSTTELRTFPGSDPMLMDAYHWALAHSPSLKRVVQQLAIADRAARYRLVPGLEPNYGRLAVQPTEKGYEIEIQVSILAWNRCGDALEPWIASALFLALETTRKGGYQAIWDARHMDLLMEETMPAAFAFLAQVRKEFSAADPERLKDLPDGAMIYNSKFKPVRNPTGMPMRRPLPDGFH